MKYTELFNSNTNVWLLYQLPLFSFTVTMEMKNVRNERTKLKGTWDILQYMKRENFLKHVMGFL